ncbi:hypothetical protein ASNO1_34810 [Corallococcus caeni]|uniref:Lipoprotein n=1 Tax=Corallococcus caeni TaxID=3082388 RepID=A0ABQ6QV97_9BACT|nr:hypothetical protein ASNO1_34810 [Corallococcus sp. NO1]
MPFGLALVAVLGFGTALVGCGGVSDSASDTVPASSEQQLVQCSSNDQCGPGDACINNACRPIPIGGRPCAAIEEVQGGAQLAGSTYCGPSEICCLTTLMCVQYTTQCPPPVYN